MERGIGDVLLTWENEAFLAIKELGPDQFEIVAPAESILAEPPIALIDKVVDKRGTRPVAQAYLDYLYSDEGQKLIGKHFYRPSNPAIAAQFAGQFPAIRLFTIDERLGGWRQAQQTHFADGGVFDQIYQ